MKRLPGLLLVLIPLCGLSQSASVLSSCLIANLNDLVRHIELFDVPEGIYNDDSINIGCKDGYEPSVAGAQAVCRAGRWDLPGDFHCRKPGYCRLFVKSGPSIKVLPVNGPLTSDIVENGERIIVNCKSDKNAKTYSCSNGEWFPRESIPCKIIACPPPPDLAHGSYIRASEEIAEPLCNGGYQKVGSPSLYCRNGTWVVKKDQIWPSCDRTEVTKTRRTPLQQLQWVAIGAGVLVLIGGVVLVLFCYLRKDSPKRNRLMHTNSHVDELLHLRRTKPIVIPDPISHTQVHYTHDRKPIPVTSL